MITEICAQQLDQASNLPKAIGSQRHLQVFSLLADGESRVDALDALLSLSQSELSQHLAHLLRDGLVSNNRQTQTIYNWLAGHEVRTIL
jgi:DNA-binding transcriptional ArsR family regulator